MSQMQYAGMTGTFGDTGPMPDPEDMQERWIELRQRMREDALQRHRETTAARRRGK